MPLRELTTNFLIKIGMPTDRQSSPASGDVQMSIGPHGHTLGVPLACRRTCVLEQMKDHYVEVAEHG